MHGAMIEVINNSSTEEKTGYINIFSVFSMQNSPSSDSWICTVNCQNVSLPARYTVYSPENTSSFKLVYKASKTVSRVLCECGALATLRFRHLGHWFMKHFCQQDIATCSGCRVAATHELKGCTNDQWQFKRTDTAVPNFLYPN